ncbi:hypothetical protein [Salegentibacter salegens]|uniref:Auto-transporter adhesin, head GIN domain n=1 Tax=Salegentibacter salegens TaxID=143223 RepID=A0A1M7HKU8_9FLAO|nr:hypothetical protein [Salegentibacter salegens]PRX39057.1 hypothetical protein LY58_03404 [Salegentibacter salegens]SHM29126.1 hypothetical protein SAMN05878281_0179 [Salegentibacter salegens]
MKLSNIILTIFAILFIIYVFGIAAEIRFRGEERAMFVNHTGQQLQDGCTSNFRKDIPLPTFKILKIKKISEVGRITFSVNARNTFSVFAENKIELPDLEYHVSGDTLIIDRMYKQGLCNEFRIELGDSNTQIIADTMTINLSSKLDSIKTIDVKGSHTSFNLQSTNPNLIAIDTLRVDLTNNSSINSHSTVSVQHMAGGVHNNSRIELWNSQVESANVKIGKQSGITIDAKHYSNPDSSVQLIYQKTKP